MKDAYRVLRKTCSHDVVSWIAMLGHAKEAIAHFEQTCEEGVEPDNVTFVCDIINLCFLK
jgi:hypothetical protein